MPEKAKKKRAVGKVLPNRGKLPTKRTINLATAGVEKMNYTAATAGIILIVIAAVLFSKFAVADRLIAMGRAEGRVIQLQNELNSDYAKISSFGDIEQEYAHYTYSGMTEEELSLVPRTAVIEMIDKEISSTDETSSWTVSGNILTVSVIGDSLEEINTLARRLETYDLVSLCTVTNAVKDEKSSTVNGRTVVEAGKVRANIIAFLQNGGKEDGK